MKLITITFIALLLCNALTAQKVLLTIAPNEDMLYAESNLALFDMNGTLQVCTTDGQGNYYVYKNDKKSGPYNDVQKAVNQIDYPENDFSQDDPGDEPVNEAFNEQWVNVDESGNLFLKAGNRKMGPFSNVKDLYFSPDKQRYFAVVSKLTADYSTTTKYEIISSDNAGITIPGEPSDLITDGMVTIAVVLTKTEKKDAERASAMEHYNKKMEEISTKLGQEDLSIEEITKMGEEINALQESAGEASLEYYIYTSKGQKMGPFNYATNPGFGVNAGAKWHMVADGQLYIAGKAVKQIGEVDLNGFWWSKNGSAYAYSSYDQLVFSDGASFPFPIQMKVVEEGGKTVLKWLALLDERKFVAYSKAL